MSIFKQPNFPKTLCLADYAALVSQCELVQRNDSEDFRKFCTDCVVVCEAIPPTALSCDVSQGRSVRDVLTRVIEADIRSSSSNSAEYKDRNVLSLGYRSKRWHTELEVKDSMGVECYFVNTLHSFFMARNWELVLSRVGERVLQHILTQPLLFPSGSSSFVQISGKAMPHCLRRTVPRHKNLSEKQSRRGFFFSQPLPRHCMFYNSHCSRPGLPRKHILNKSATTSQMLVQDMLVCFSSLCDGSGFDYRKRKKQRQGQNSETKSGMTENCCVGEEHTDMITLTQHQKVLMEEMAGDILKGYQSCNIPFLLDHYCPSPRIIEGEKSKTKFASKEKCKLKKTRRGCRAGRKVRLRTGGISPVLTPSNLGEKVLPHHMFTSSVVAGRQTSEKAPTTTHQELSSIRIPSHEIRRDIVSPDKTHSVGHRLVEQVIYDQFNTAHMDAKLCAICQAWRNGKLDLLIEEQDLPSQDSNFSFHSVDLLEDVECVAQNNRETSTGMDAEETGAGFHIRMRTMATVASDPASWIHSDNESYNSIKGAEEFLSSPRVRVHHHQDTHHRIKLSDNDASTNKHGNAETSAHIRNSVTNNFEMASSSQDVAKFVQAVCRQLFPISVVWNSRHSTSTRLNSNLFMKRIAAFVNLGRWESLNVNQLSQGMKCSFIPWLISGQLWKDNPVPTVVKNRNRCRKRVRKHLPETSRGSPSDYRWQTDLSDSDHVVLSIFLGWIFTEIIPPLIATCFYATEGEGTGSQVLYYRKKEWEKLRIIGEAQMASHFVKVVHGSKGPMKSSAVESTRDKVTLNSLYPSVRFVPKKTSVRAITNMKSSFYRGATTTYNIPTPNIVSSTEGFPPTATSTSCTVLPHTLTNASLYNALHVLRHIHHRYHPSAGGFGVSGVEEACERFRTYRLMNPRPAALAGSNDLKNEELGIDNNEQPYYIAVLDIDKCFDNVDTAKLYDVAVNLVKSCIPGTTRNSNSLVSQYGAEGQVSRATTCLPENYRIHRYNVSMYLPSAERFVSRSIRHVGGIDNFISFQESSEGLAKKHHNAIVTDGVVYPTLSREELLKIIRQHLFHHAVRMPEQSRQKRKLGEEGNKQLFTQVKGIPQGSALSPLLCNLYYGHVENETFGSNEERDLLGLNDASSVIVRVMDDYLMISTRKSTVAHFLQRAHTCFKPFGGGFNPSKTKVNFDLQLDVDGISICVPRISQPAVTWCGFSINQRTLEILPSFSKLLGSGIKNSITRDCSRAGVAFRKSLKGFIRPRIHSIILDSSINRFGTVTKSIYSLFLTAAMRSDLYLRSGANPLRLALVDQNVSFISRCIIEVVYYGARLAIIRGRRIRKPIIHHDRERTAVKKHFSEEPRTKDKLEFPPREKGSLYPESTTFMSSANTCEDNGVDAVATPLQSSQMCSLSQDQIKWLGFRAFFSVFSCHRAVYAKILKILHVQIARIKGALSKNECHILSDYAESIGTCDIDVLQLHSL